MTKQQILWARAHDWYCSDNGSVVTVWDYVLDSATGEYTTTTRQFTDVRALKVWANY